jgi:tetratricopeptide (TPR) repeat protein
MYDRNVPRGTRRRAARRVACAGVFLAGMAATAAADELVIQDPETCERKVVRAEEIGAETWLKVQYREKPRAPFKEAAAADVVEIRRSSNDPQADRLLEAMDELRKGNVQQAREALQKVNGGGWKVDMEGKRSYSAFNEGDAQGRGKRPSWINEYSHFHYAKALVLEGTRLKKKDVLEEALLALDDLPIPGGDGKKKTGGFLARFKDGNSRWYPDALLLRAEALLGLGRYDEAAKAYDDLYKAVPLGLHPRWALEAKLGPGAIAEAQEKPVEAVTAYTAAADVMSILLGNETRACFRRELGRYYSQARARAIAVLLKAAEAHKSKAEFANLRTFIDEGSPESIRKKFGSRPKPEVEALVAGARDPKYQAVAQNGLGLAYLNEGRAEEAVLAFLSVSVKYFAEHEEVPRALFYLGEAAAAAGKDAKGDAAKYYASLREQAAKSLQSDYPGSPFARGK